MAASAYRLATGEGDLWDILAFAGPLPVQIFQPRHSACFRPSRGDPVIVFEHAAEPGLATERAPA
jgi:hypothetical protein